MARPKKIDVGDGTELKLTPSQVKLTVIAGISGRVPICLWGPPGIGKSALIESLAKELGFGFIDVRAAYFDPVDLRGIPTVVHDSEKNLHYTIWCRPAFLPKEDCGPTIILADELNRAPTLVQNSFFQMIQEGQIGEHKLPSNVYVMAACNYETDGGGLNRMPSALYNRFQHIHMKEDLKDWIDWGYQAGIYGNLIAYHRNTEGSKLFAFDREAKAWPSPRSWENLSKVAHQLDKLFPRNERSSLSAEKLDERRHVILANYAGTVGLGYAGEFIAYEEELIDLPSAESILADPDGAPIIRKLSALYAVISNLCLAVKPITSPALVRYCNRLSAEGMEEYSVMCIRDTWRRDRNLMACEEFGLWAQAHKMFISELAGEMNTELEKIAQGVA